MISGRNISCILTEADRVFHIESDTVSMVAMPLFHIGGTGWALCGKSRGGHSTIVRDIDPVEILRLVENHEITHTFVVPAVLMFLLAVPELADADVSSLRTVFYGASPISEDVLVRSMHAFGCDFAQVYGLTETTGAITSLMPEDHDPDGPRPVLLRSAERPFDHVELRIIDTDSGEDLPVGAVGEVWTRSDQNMLGYWNKAEETEAVLSEDGWFRTGDAGWIDADGYLFLHDRIKDVFVSKKRDLNATTAFFATAIRSHGVPAEVTTDRAQALVRVVADLLPAALHDRFSCSMPAPATSSRHLYTEHRQGHIQAAPWLRAERYATPLSRDRSALPVLMPS